MADKEIAIKVTSLAKTFQPQSSSRTIKEAFISTGRRLSGKRKLSHHQGEYTALKDINFEVNKGDFFGIVGRNGCGKSTLLKILAGVYAPTKGSVQINGKLTPFIELGVGFNPELSGRDNVFLNGALLGFTRKQMEEMYDDIVNFAELHEFMDTKLKNYSSGMQVRLAFSVAIRAESDILLIDEVLAVGDAAFQQKCFNYFLELKKNKRTVVFVSHDMPSVNRFCDKAIYVSDGEIQLIAKPNEITEMYVRDNFGVTEASTPNKKEKTRMPIELSFYLDSTTLAQGDKLTGVLKIDSIISANVVVGLSILKDGIYVGGFNTKKYRNSINLKKGITNFNFSINTKTLSGGNYHLGSGVFEHSTFKPLGINTTDSVKFKLEMKADYKDGISDIDGDIFVK